MNEEEFLKAIDYYGESNILGIGFDNSAAITFGSGEFSLANNYNSAITSLTFIGFDSKGFPYHIIKPIVHINAIIVRDSKFDFNVYDRISLRC